MSQNSITNVHGEQRKQQ